MSRATLHALAAAAGVSRLWTDADGARRTVSDDSLRAILSALGHAAGDDAQVEASRSEIAGAETRAPVLMTADAGKPVTLPAIFADATLLGEDGAPLDFAPTKGIAAPGYYRLVKDDEKMTIAVAPARCPALEGRRWGVAIQIPSLRGRGDFGDFGDLERAVVALGEAGADAVALSPVHALSLADPGRFAPYSSSSRIALNALLGDADTGRTGAQDDLVDWTQAGPAKLQALRARLGPDDRALQDNARAGLDRVQRAARSAGMNVGLIADLAVGVDPAGEEASADPSLFLQGLRIGAPPDPLGPQGQDWGLTSYSPAGLARSGFAPFIAMLRANIPQGGGIRIDHAFGLKRLWVVPAGRPASEGAYITYPFANLLRLVKLEAWRAGAVVIAEDLGTRPPGFVAPLRAAGVYGMAVLPFARDMHGGFQPASAYPASAVAMSATHDTATLAGWWTGRDLEWNEKLKRGGQSAADRAKDRSALWAVVGAGAPQPPDDAASPVVDAALAFLATTPCPLMITPMEDLVGLLEQPNLPGTIDEHPNWRRRLPEPVDALLRRPDVERRIAMLNKERGG